MSILEVFGLHQLITKPTRVTKNSKSLIDLCITNSPDRIVDSGVIPLGISDHSLVYMCRKSFIIQQQKQQKGNCKTVL